MRADMVNKIQIQKLVKNKNDFGEVKEDWVTVFTAYASKEQLLGREFYQAEAIQSKVEVKYRTYWMPGVTNDMRIKDSEGIYSILSSVNVKSLNRELLLYCKKVK